MRKKYKLSIFLCCVLVALSGCGKAKEKTEPTVVKPVIVENEEDSSDADATPLTGVKRSRLTNEFVSEDVANTRPVALMIPNSGTASFYGLSKADILYECNVEGSMTRLMAIFGDWKNSEKLGNIRSARDYFVYWAFEWDAIFMHYGGPFYIDDVLSRDDTQSINCLNYETATFRDEAKNSTDNAFTSGEKIQEAMEHFGYSEKYRSGYADEAHFIFASDDAPNTLEQYSDAIDAEKIDMSLCYPVTNCYFVYNPESGVYERFQKPSDLEDGPHIDEENNKQLSFKNVIVQNTYHEVRDQKGYLAFQVHDNTRDGWYFTNGKGVHVTWDKVTDYGATRYFDDDGNEIQLNTGKTMILIVEAGDSFKVNDKIIKPE